MMDINYIVQFVRKDGKPNEEYYYFTREEAEQHFRLFRDDDSGLYKEICLLSWVGNDTKILQRLEFK